MSAVFSYQALVTARPEFANVSQPLMQAYWNEAGLFFDQQRWGQLAQAQTLMNLLTWHLAWLYSPRDANGMPASTGTAASPLVGRVSSASEGSVSVSTELTSGGAPSAAFFEQTKYGLQFWQATAQFRTATYRPSPYPNRLAMRRPFGRVSW